MFGYVEEVANEVLKKLEEGCTNFTTESQDCKNRAATLRQEATELREKAKKAREDAETLRTEAETLRKEAEQLIKDSENAKKDAQKLREEAADLRRQAADLTRQASKLITQKVYTTNSDGEKERDYDAERQNSQQAAQLDKQAANLEQQADQNEKQAEQLDQQAEQFVKDAEQKNKDAEQKDKDAVKLDEDAEKMDEEARIDDIEAGMLDTLSGQLAFASSSLEEQLKEMLKTVEETRAALKKTTSLLDFIVNGIVNAFKAITTPPIKLLADAISNVVDIPNIIQTVTDGFKNLLGNSLNVVSGITGGLADMLLDDDEKSTGSAEQVKGVTVSAVQIVGSSFNSTTQTINDATVETATEINKVIDEAKDLYVQYLNKFNYTEEEKQQFVLKFNTVLNNVAVSSKEALSGIPLASNIMASYNGVENKIYLNQESAIDVMSLTQNANNGMGTMAPNGTLAYWQYSPETNEFSLKANENFDSTQGLLLNGYDYGAGIYSGINDASNGLLAKDICGTANNNYTFNNGTYTLENITTSITNHCGINGEQLLCNTYVGENKNLLASKYNEIMGNDNAYNELVGALYEEKMSGSYSSGAKLDSIAFEFETKARNIG